MGHFLITFLGLAALIAFFKYSRSTFWEVVLIILMLIWARSQ